MFYPVVHAVKEEEAWSGPLHPTYFGYGWMRGYLEKLAEFAATRSSMKVALTRPTAVYGRGTTSIRRRATWCPP